MIDCLITTLQTIEIVSVSILIFCVTFVGLDLCQQRLITKGSCPK